MVIGTRLKIPGARRLVREFCRGVQGKGGLAVWINKEPIPSGLERCFNLALYGDCDEITLLLLS